jgi:hypothetical protein
MRKNFLKSIRTKTLIIAILILFFTTSNTTPGEMTNNKFVDETEIYVNNLRTKMKNELTKEVHNYIKLMAPGSNLNPEYLVEKCLEYETDIIFVLSQALLESHFGTRGKAAQTNSVWNVGTYDDGQVLYRYKTVDESLEPYLKLINEKYLINITSKGDTIYKDLGHLVQDRGYINYNGSRFASARGYENGMRKFMVKIDMETSISFYQDILRLTDQEILAFFIPETTIYEEFYALN